MTPSRVEKVIDCSLTGQRLGVIIHNDLNSPIYLCWITETGTFKYRLHKEVVLSRRRLAAFCNELNIPGVVGLAVFLVRGITYGRRSQNRTLYLFTKSYLRKSNCVEKLLPEIPKGRKYKLFHCN